MNDRLLSFLGLCRRAKKCVIGADVTVESLQSGKALLVLFAEDASENSLKKVRRTAAARGVDVLSTRRSKEQLSIALGKLCGVLSVEDRGFAGKLRTMILNEQNEQGGEFDDKI